MADGESVHNLHIVAGEFSFGKTNTFWRNRTLRFSLLHRTYDGIDLFPLLVDFNDISNNLEELPNSFIR